ncbi:MAG: hypothetical protein M1839_002420 [Geoglossum umbratile]|nr:MAG: hypothetical protein M1839_002420 [Geoglossum umbratile]
MATPDNLAVKLAIPIPDIQELKEYVVAGAPLIGADVEVFECNRDDLQEAVTHCVSTSFALPFLPDSDLTISLADDPKLDGAAKSEGESATPAITQHVVARMGSKSNVEQPAAMTKNETVPEVAENIADDTILGNAITLNFKRGYLQYDGNGDPKLPPGTDISITEDSTGERFITYINLTDEGVDENAEAFMGRSPAKDSAEPDYPLRDLRGYPCYAFNRKYRYGFDQHHNLIMRTPEVQRDHFEYSEHALIGDDLQLKWFRGNVVRAGEEKLELENGLKLTYGEINGLGGDFYGGKKPICLGETFEEQCDLFIRAYNCLGKDEGRVIKECQAIIDSRGAETKALLGAISNGTSTVEAYKKLASEGGFFGHKDEFLLQALTISRPDSGEFDAPSYLRLAQLNLDHFGEDAHKAYNAGHFCAMKKAAEGNLPIAYAMNAFADHYLGDCFAAGHMRTPRRALHAWGGRAEAAWKLVNPITFPILLAPDMCSKYMHDEDNARGLLVANRAGQQWTAFGDKRMFAPENEANCKRMRTCLQASANEIWDSFKKGKVAVTDPEKFAAWDHAPTLKSVFGPQRHAPLFTKDGHIRDNIDKPEEWKHHKLSWFDPWVNVYRRLSQSKTMSGY